MGVVLTTVVLEVVFVATAVGWRTAQQRRRTGSPGFVVLRERGAAARAAGLLLAAGLVLLAAGPALRLGDAGAGWSPVPLAGVAAMVGGLVLTLVAQQQMGASWRIGVDPDERTRLVTAGVFGSVRNPIFTAMMLFAVGAALAASGVLSALGAAALVGGIVLQVLLVEEPHLAAVHGGQHAAYRLRAGGFHPGVAPHQGRAAAAS